MAANDPKLKMKVLREDYYDDEVKKIKADGYKLKDIEKASYLNYSSGNTLPVNKNVDKGYGTFDDGLLF